MCYRDVVRDRYKKEFFRSLDECPKCHELLDLSDGSFVCGKCDDDLSDLIPPYKALDKCRSLHAEETAILIAPRYQIDGSTLFTTTFPCMQCAKRILQTDIKHVVYIDPYPEKESMIMLEDGKVFTEKFDGVKAQAYYRLFYPYRESLEKKLETI